MIRIPLRVLYMGRASFKSVCFCSFCCDSKVLAVRASGFVEFQFLSRGFNESLYNGFYNPVLVFLCRVQ